MEGPDENARQLGLAPLLSGQRSEDEGLFVRQHDYWAKTLLAGLAAGVPRTGVPRTGAQG